MPSLQTTAEEQFLTKTEQIRKWLSEPKHHQSLPSRQHSRLCLYNPAFTYRDLRRLDVYAEDEYIKVRSRYIDTARLAQKQYQGRIKYNSDLTREPPIAWTSNPSQVTKDELRKQWFLAAESRRQRIAYWAWKMHRAVREEERLRREISWCQDN